jgi:hypothetical protein
MRASGTGHSLASRLDGTPLSDSQSVTIMSFTDSKALSKAH